MKISPSNRHSVSLVLFFLSCTLSSSAVSCAPKVGGFHESQMNGLATTASMRAGDAAADVERLSDNNQELESLVFKLRTAAERAEAQSAVCGSRPSAKSSTKTKSKPPKSTKGSYSRIR